jgi:hypothetical protein
MHLIQVDVLDAHATQRARDALFQVRRRQIVVPAANAALGRDLNFLARAGHRLQALLEHFFA